MEITVISKGNNSIKSQEKEKKDRNKRVRKEEEKDSHYITEGTQSLCSHLAFGHLAFSYPHHPPLLSFSSLLPPFKSIEPRTFRVPRRDATYAA